MDIHSHLNQAQSDDDHDIIIKMMGMRLIVTPISIRLQLMMITVIMTMMMILWKKLIFTDILILILICRWFCYAMYLPYAFFPKVPFICLVPNSNIQCSLWKLGGNWMNASMSFVCCGPQSKFAGKYARNVCNGVIGALVAENLKHSSTKLSC